MAYGQGGWRRRNMYRLTGLPGWMRFGHSPGWEDKNPTGLPPTAQYSMQTGQVPQPMPLAQTVPPTHENCVHFKDGFCTLYGIQMDPNTPTCPNFTPKNSAPAPQTPPTHPMFQAPADFPPAQIPKKQEIQILEDQARMFEQQLKQIKKRLEELKKEVK